MKTITLIAAMDRLRCIGKNGKLPFDDKEDMRFFRDATMGKPCIMGRKTYEEIGKPLKGRINIVVSHKSNFNDVINASSYEDALGIAENYTDNEIMVIGGGEIYKEAIKTADAMILTVFDTVFDGDVFFPSFHQVDAFLPIDDDTPHLREDMWKHNLFTTWDGTRIYRCDRVMKGAKK